MSWLAARRDEARIACMLLTRLPMGRLSDPAPPMARAAWAFPLAALPVALVVWITLTLATAAGLPALAAALLAIGASALITGALHEDGLADVADGFGGGTTRMRKLEIMRDSRIGSYGVLALLQVIGLKASALATLTTSPILPLALLATAALSRSTMAVLLTTLPAARTDGLGHAATLQDKAQSTAALALALAATLPLALTAPASALLILLIAAIVSSIMHLLARKHIGGQTGDVLGATQLLSETAMLIALTTTL